MKYNESKTKKALLPIRIIIDNIRREYPVIGNEYDGNIYYMNGNDGTEFDWEMNYRVCEFIVWHENENGYIKLFVNRDGSIEGYVYPSGEMKPRHTITSKYPYDTQELYELLLREFDGKNIYDKPIIF